MAEKRTDTFNELLDETIERLEAQLKFMRRQKSALSVADGSAKVSVCLAHWEACPSAAGLLPNLRTQLDRKLAESMTAFWQELSDEVSARGLACASLTELICSIAEQEYDYANPISIKIGVFTLVIDFVADSVGFYIGGVVAAKPCTLSPSSVVENLCKLELELKEKRTVPRLALMRLVTAASVLSAERMDFTLEELWPIVHSIGLVAGNFGRHPSKANLNSYTKAQFMYDTVQAFGDILHKNIESNAVVLEGSLDNFSLESKVKILRNGASNDK